MSTQPTSRRASSACQAPATGALRGQLDLDCDRAAAFGDDEHELNIVADWLGGLP